MISSLVIELARCLNNRKFVLVGWLWNGMDRWFVLIESEVVDSRVKIDDEFSYF